MYRIPGAAGSSKSTNATEEKISERQKVWHSVYLFIGYVVLLRIGTLTFIMLCVFIVK